MSKLEVGKKYLYINSLYRKGAISTIKTIENDGIVYMNEYRIESGKYVKMCTDTIENQSNYHPLPDILEIMYNE